MPLGHRGHANMRPDGQPPKGGRVHSRRPRPDGTLLVLRADVGGASGASALDGDVLPKPDPQREGVDHLEGLQEPLDVARQQLWIGGLHRPCGLL